MFKYGPGTNNCIVNRITPSQVSATQFLFYNSRARTRGGEGQMMFADFRSILLAACDTRKRTRRSSWQQLRQDKIARKCDRNVATRNLKATNCDCETLELCRSIGAASVRERDTHQTDGHLRQLVAVTRWPGSALGWQFDPASSAVPRNTCI